MFRYFKLLLFRGFVAARKHKDEFVTALAIMAQKSQLPCFTKPTAVKVCAFVLLHQRRWLCLHRQAERETHTHTRTRTHATHARPPASAHTKT